MTTIEISGLLSDLKEIKEKLEKGLPENKVDAKLSISSAHFDSADTATNILPVLQVVFAGVIATTSTLTLILNTIYKIQESKQKTDSKKKTPISMMPTPIIIRLGSGEEIEIPVSNEMTKEDLAGYLKSFIEFSNAAESEQNKKFFKVYGQEKINLSITTINKLFDSLFNKTQHLREEHVTTTHDNHGGVRVSIELIETTLLEILRKGKSTLKFYLPIEDIKECKDIFFDFETVSILVFQAEEYSIKVIDMHKSCIQYEVKKLDLFYEVIQNKEFKFYSLFNSSND